MIDLITKYGTHCEILYRDVSENIRRKNFATLKSKNIKIIAKTMNSFVNMELFDGIIFKNAKSAGRITNEIQNFEESIRTFVSMYPNKAIIPCGGVGNKSDVDNLLSIGSTAVGIGTLFAFSSESCISTNTKNKIIQKTKEDIIRFEMSQNVKQNAILFSNWNKDDDINHSKSLQAGILNSNEGHIFVGEAINHINSIKTFQNIVDDLTL